MHRTHAGLFYFGFYTLTNFLGCCIVLCQTTSYWRLFFLNNKSKITLKYIGKGPYKILNHFYSISQSLTIIKYSKTYWKCFRKCQDQPRRICGKKTAINRVSVCSNSLNNNLMLIILFAKLHQKQLYLMSSRLPDI